MERIRITPVIPLIFFVLQAYSQDEPSSYAKKLVIYSESVENFFPPLLATAYREDINEAVRGIQALEAYGVDVTKSLECLEIVPSSPHNLITLECAFRVVLNRLDVNDVEGAWLMCNECVLRGLNAKGVESPARAHLICLTTLRVLAFMADKFPDKLTAKHDEQVEELRSRLESFNEPEAHCLSSICWLALYARGRGRHAQSQAIMSRVIRQHLDAESCCPVAGWRSHVIGDISTLANWYVEDGDSDAAIELLQENIHLEADDPVRLTRKLEGLLKSGEK